MTSLCWPFPTRDAGQYRRIDQGWDLQTAPGTPVLAVAAGVVSYAHDPGTNGGHFGDPYPILTLDQADPNGPVVYYGHVYPDVADGTRVTQGQRIAHTGAPGGGGAPDGWLEIGWWRNGPTGDGVAMHDALINGDAPKEAHVTRKGLDCTASGYPGAAWMAANGYTFGVGYVSAGTGWKDLTRAMVDDMAAHGIDVVTNYEAEAAPGGGYPEGYAAGQRVAAKRDTLGMPDGRPGIPSFDYDVQPGDYPMNDDYLRGFRAGDPRGGLPGNYSNGAYLMHALDAGLISVAWLSESTGFAGHQEAINSGRMVIVQRPGTANYDLDTAYVADFGQWRPGQPASPIIPKPDPVEELLNMAQDNNLTVEVLYWLYLGRQPDTEGLKTYVAWLNAHEGTPGAIRAVATQIRISKECTDRQAAEAARDAFVAHQMAGK